MNWKLAEAKNKFSEVFDRAAAGELQRVNRRGETVVILAEKQYLAETRQEESFLDFLRSGPQISELELPDRSELVWNRDSS